MESPRRVGPTRQYGGHQAKFCHQRAPGRPAGDPRRRGPWFGAAPLGGLCIPGIGGKRTDHRGRFADQRGGFRSDRRTHWDSRHQGILRLRHGAGAGVAGFPGRSGGAQRLRVHGRIAAAGGGPRRVHIGGPGTGQHVRGDRRPGRAAAQHRGVLRKRNGVLPPARPQRTACPTPC